MKDDDLRPRLGRIADRGGPPRPRVRRRAPASFRALARGRPRAGRGREAALLAQLQPRSRRVVVKLRRIPHPPAGAGRALRAHMRYLRRQEAGPDGGPALLFDREGEADARAFARRCDQGPGHFRIIVAPQDGAELADLVAYGRRLMRQAERDLDTRLDWIAAAHFDNGHPHLHFVVRAATAEGEDLRISRDYAAFGLRARAEALAELELGPRLAREVAPRRAPGLALEAPSPGRGRGPGLAP